MCNLIFVSFFSSPLCVFSCIKLNALIVLLTSSTSVDSKTMENNIQRNGEPETPKGPPQVPITKSTPSANNLGSNSVKKDKRMSSSRFNISKNRELAPLPRLTGKCVKHTFCYHLILVTMTMMITVICFSFLMNIRRSVGCRTRRPVHTENATMLRFIRFYGSTQRFKVERSKTNCLA